MIQIKWTKKEEFLEDIAKLVKDKFGDITVHKLCTMLSDKYGKSFQNYDNYLRNSKNCSEDYKEDLIKKIKGL
jgi:hypothetical protein